MLEWRFSYTRWFYCWLRWNKTFSCVLAKLVNPMWSVLSVLPKHLSQLSDRVPGDWIISLPVLFNYQLSLIPVLPKSPSKLPYIRCIGSANSAWNPTILMIVLITLNFLFKRIHSFSCNRKFMFAQAWECGEAFRAISLATIHHTN